MAKDGKDEMPESFKSSDIVSHVTWIETTGYLDFIQYPQRYARSDMMDNFMDGCNVTIYRVEGLSPPTPSPYLVVYVSGADTSRPFLAWGKHRSTHLDDTLNPVFNISISIPLSEVPLPELSHLVVQVWNHRSLLPDDLLGEAVIPLSRPMKKEKERYDLVPPPRGLLSSLTPMSHQPPPDPVCGHVVLDIEIVENPKMN
jgi:hypothetical protein